MPIIRVEMYPGRSVEQKRELVAAFTDAMVRIGRAAPESVVVVFHEVAPENWGEGGRTPADQPPRPR